MVDVSVISPVYNTSEYLREFLDSVISQTYKPFELILVDDGSSDNSLDICREYAEKDSRITVLTQKNQGAGAARNNGIEHANGELVIFLDSDDTADSNMLEAVLKVTRKQKPDLLVFGYEEIFYNEAGKVVSRNVMLPEPLDLHTPEECRKKYCRLVFDAMLNQPWNKVYKKSIIEKYNIRFPNVKRTQDALFNGEYFKHVNSLLTLQEPLYFFRQNNQKKIWKKFPKDSYLIDVNYNSFLENLLKEFNLYDGESRALADEWFYNTIFRDAGYYKNPNWKLSRKEKIEYVRKVISAEYNKERAKTAWTRSKKTASVRKRILKNDAKGLIRDIRYFTAREKSYEYYYRTVRKRLKGDK